MTRYHGDDGGDSDDNDAHSACDEIDDNEQQQQLIDLDNFDELRTEPPILTSPRSIEACRMQGIDPEDLVQRPLAFFFTHSVHTRSSAAVANDPALAEKRAARYEKDRQLQLRNARAQRYELIDAGLRGMHGGMSLYTRSFCRSPIGAQLSRSRYDASTFSNSSSSRLASTAIERERKEIERMQQRQVAEMQQLLAFELTMAEREDERARMDREKQQHDEQLARERTRRQREADERKRERDLAKAAQHKLELELARDVALKEQLLAQRDAQRQQQRERAQRLMARKLRDKQERSKLRLTSVLLDKARRLAQQQSDAAAKQQQSDARLQQRERERLDALERQHRDEQQREREREAAQTRMAMQLEQQQRAFAERAEAKAVATQRMLAFKQQSLRAKLQDAQVRDEAITAARARQQRQDAYKTELLQARIASDNDRMRSLESERAMLLRRRQQLAQHASRQKQELAASFDRMRVTKKLVLPTHIGVPVRPHSAAGGIRLKTQSLTDRLTSSPSPLPRQHGGAWTTKVNAKRPATAAAVARPVSLVRRHSDENTAAGLECDDYDEAADGSSETVRAREHATNVKALDDAVGRAEIDALRRTHNEELLAVLEEEHHAEEQREHIMRQTRNDSEHARIESIFNKERALASERIMKITQRHERVLAARMREVERSDEGHR